MPRSRVAQLVCSAKLARLADAPHHMQKLMWHLQLTYVYMHTHAYMCQATFRLLHATCHEEKCKKACGNGPTTAQLTAVDIYMKIRDV